MIFEQISIIYQLPRLFVGSFTLVLPYFPTGTGQPAAHLPLRPRLPRPAQLQPPPPPLLLLLLLLLLPRLPLSAACCQPH